MAQMEQVVWLAAPARRKPEQPAESSTVPGLRASLYALGVDVGGDTTLLLHQPSGSVDRLPSDLAAQILQRPSSLPIEAVEYFTRRGYLTELSERDEEAQFVRLVEELETARSDVFAAPLFSFVTTYSCNLACSYCFQSNTGVREAEERRMTVETARRFLRVVAKAPRHPERNVIELFGGEPLLPSLRPVVEEIVLDVEALGYTVRATTNGTGLDAYLDLLGPSRIAELQISLDGSREFHDRRRIGVGGKPTFDKIWKNIRSAVDAGTFVMIRANLDKRNLAGFADLAEFLDEQGYLEHPRCRLDYIDVKPDPIAPDYGKDYSVSLAEIEDTLQFQRDDHPVLNKVAGPHEIGSFDEWLSKTFHNMQTRHCGAVTNNVYFSPDGLIYSCHETAGRPEFAIGKVEGDDIVYNSSADHWRSRRVDKLRACRRCPYALTCSGGCAARTDILCEPDQHFCDDFDSKFRSVLRRQYQATLSHS